VSGVDPDKLAKRLFYILLVSTVVYAALGAGLELIF